MPDGRIDIQEKDTFGDAWIEETRQTGRSLRDLKSSLPMICLTLTSEMTDRKHWDNQRRGS